MTDQTINNSLFKTFIAPSMFVCEVTLFKRTVVNLVLLLTLCTSYSQQTTAINGQYSNTPLTSVLTDIEEQIGYQFYYLDSWIQDISVTANFENENLTTALQLLFAETSLNFHVLEADKRIILLENTIVYDDLPNGFFGQEEVVEENKYNSFLSVNMVIYC